MIYMFLSNNPSSGDINSLNLSCFFYCRPETPKQVLSENSEDPDEMLHIAAFHQGPHCFLLQTKSIFRDRNTIFFWKL